MNKQKTEKPLNFYFQEVKNSYGLTEYICTLKYRDLWLNSAPQTKTNLCYYLEISSSEFDERIKYKNGERVTH